MAEPLRKPFLKKAGVAGIGKNTFVDVVEYERPAARVLYKAVPPEREKPAPVAIVVAHGMGQQVPFQTVEGVALEVQAAAPKVGGDPTRVQVEMVQFGETRLPRAEMTVQDSEGHNHEVHFYECYWAPLTEDKVTARDAVKFLLSAGWYGLRRCKGGGRFHRWMFGWLQEFSIKRARLFFIFLYVVAVIAALLVINATLVAVAASRPLTGTVSTWPNDALLQELTLDLVLYELVAFSFLLAGIGLPALIRWARRRIGKSGKLPAVIPRFGMAFAILAGVATLATAALFLWQLRLHQNAAAGVWWYAGWPSRIHALLAAMWSPPLAFAQNAVYRGLKLFVAAPDAHQIERAVHFVMKSVVWLLSVGLAYLVRSFLREYVGDVAAYISAHTVSKFWELRKAIHETSMKVASAVYSARTGPGENDPFLYNRIIMVGHSLGSVIAYDMLDDLLLADDLATRPNPLPKSTPLNVAGRTRALVTFGSPLDKTAYIFRTQKEEDSEVREGLAAAVQPMIVSYDNRPAQWINIWSPWDIISGSLEYYDKPENDPQQPLKPGEKEKMVINLVDSEASVPLIAHTQYWENPLLAHTLYYLITQ